jgi:hypothetical protein
MTIGDAGPIPASELAEYLMLLNGVYEFALSPQSEIGPVPTENVSQQSLIDFSDAIRHKLSQFTQEEFATGLTRMEFAPELRISIDKIEKSSPLLIWGMCQVTALALAVIVSGGEVDLKNQRFKVHALGDGLRKLRMAFTSRTRPGSSGAVRVRGTRRRG